MNDETQETEEKVGRNKEQAVKIVKTYTDAINIVRTELSLDLTADSTALAFEIVRTALEIKKF